MGFNYLDQLSKKSRWNHNCFYQKMVWEVPGRKGLRPIK